MTCTTTQSMQALAKANAVRRAWADFRRDLLAMQSHESAEQLADLLETHARGLESDALNAAAPFDVERVLTAIRRFGRERLRRLALTAGLPDLAAHAREVRVRDLSPDEAFALADALRLAHPVARFDGRAEGALRTEVDREAVIRQRLAGVPVVDVCAEHFVSASTVKRIVRAHRANQAAALRRATTTLSKGDENHG